MTSPRSQLVDPSTPGYYHCVSRCVRRAYLCGLDALSGRDFEHRKAWIETRLLELADCFAVGIYAFAVMSNHLHVVVYVDPARVADWSAEEVAKRWLRLFPVRERGAINVEACRLRAQVLAGDTSRIAELRQRLSSLSWFMRCLSEPIARRANREDACTGRFWEGRFKCQALLDDAAVLACMAYVDLNPIRAGMTSSLGTSDHTSIKSRLSGLQGDAADAELDPIAGPASAGLPLSLGEYLELADWTGRLVRPDKRGAIDTTAPPVLERLGLRQAAWSCQVQGIESRYWRAVGTVDALMEKAKSLGQCWLKGGGAMTRWRHATA
jgi:hypothetical protein